MRSVDRDGHIESFGGIVNTDLQYIVCTRATHKNQTIIL